MEDNKKVLFEKIIKMKEMGLSDEDIKEILDLNVDVELFIMSFEREKDLRTVQEVADILKAELGEEKEKFNYHKVLRLIKSGEIKAESKNSNKEGLRIHISEINDFIETRKMTLEDWKKRALAAEAMVESLKEQLSNKKD